MTAENPTPAADVIFLPAAVPAGLSDAELEGEITTWAGRVAAGEAHLLMLIGEWNAREAWAHQGLLSCAAWLSWRLGMGLEAGRERVRIAMALRELPVIAAAFSRGELSYTQVRAITRIAGTVGQPEQQWVELARTTHGQQLEKLVRAVRRATKPLGDAQDPEQAAALARPRIRYDDNGDLVITLRVPAEQGPVVIAGLERITTQIHTERQTQRQTERQAERQATPDTEAAAPDTDAAHAAAAHAAAAHAAAAHADAADVDAAHAAHAAAAAAKGVSAETPAPATPAEDVAIPEVRSSAQVREERLAAGVSAQTPDSELVPLTEAPMPAPVPPTGLFAQTPEELAARTAYQAWSEQCHAVMTHNRLVRDERERRALAAQTSPEALTAGVAALAEQPATWNDALLRLAQHALTTPGPLPLAVKERLTVRIDPLTGWTRLRDGELLPPGALTLPATEDGLPQVLIPLDLTSRDQGRSQRLVTAPLRRLLSDLDGERCRFPGCTRTSNLDAHHVRWWRHDGRTDLDNLILVCGRHHTLIHEQGFQLELHPDRTLHVTTTDGTPIAHHPATRPSPRPTSSPWTPPAPSPPTRSRPASTPPASTGTSPSGPSANTPPEAMRRHRVAAVGRDEPRGPGRRTPPAPR